MQHILYVTGRLRAYQLPQYLTLPCVSHGSNLAYFERDLHILTIKLFCACFNLFPDTSFYEYGYFLKSASYRQGYVCMELKHHLLSAIMHFRFLII